jgi:hypothetical protein
VRVAHGHTRHLGEGRRGGEGQRGREGETTGSMARQGTMHHAAKNR